MATSEKRILAALPKLDSRRVDMLLEDVIGCQWTISVLRAVAHGVNRPGALERYIDGISTKVLSDRLRHFTRAGIFEREQFPSSDRFREEVSATLERGGKTAGRTERGS
jgi:DNA-binding HxlR family transcriptional regulator